MSTMKRFTFLCFICIAPLACGGGGTTGELLLAPQNAEAVAEEGVEAGELVGGLAEIVQPFLSVVEDQTAQTIPCDSGNLGVQVNDAAPLNVLSTGDSATLTFNACVIDLLGGVTINGVVSFSADEITGIPPGAFDYRVTYTFQAFSVSIFGATVVVDGAFTLEIGSADGETGELIVSGSSLSAFAIGPAGAAFSGTIRDFLLERTENTTSGAYTHAFDATVSGSEIGGTVTFVTTLPFTGTGDADPGSGSIAVTGAQGSTLTLVALDSVNVQLLLDIDGDGETDVTIDTTWAELDDNDDA